MKKPDTINGQFVLFSENQPFPLRSQIDGTIIYLSNSGDSVDIGQDVAYIKQSADYCQVMRLYEVLKNTQKRDLLNIDSEHYDSLGDLSEHYSGLINAIKKYNAIKKSKTYVVEKIHKKFDIKSIRQSLISEKTNLLHEKEVLVYLEREFYQDSLLWINNSITMDAYIQSRLKVIRQRETVNQILSKLENFSIEIQNSENSITGIDVQYEENLESALLDAENKFNSLCNAIQIWRAKYVMTTRIKGTVENVYGIENNHTIVDGTEIARIIPNITELTNQINFSNINAAKVHNGSDVKLYLYDYDRNTYGFLIGTVKSISKSIVMGNDAQSSYVGSLDIDWNNQPYFKGDFRLVHGMRGEARIIVQDRPLIVAIVNWMEEFL